MSEIKTLSPNIVWHWFDKICAIPHPSFHEDALSQFIIDWAQSKQLFVERDEVGNILIKKAATAGMENRPAVALQAHLDMVPQANEDTQHDFTKDPILPVIDGDWVKASGTTLGADNGIGMASCLAVLDSDDLVHTALEILLTMTEETGMVGVKGLRPDWLQAEMMINTDTEENGEIYIGCAGGEDANIELPITRENNPFDAAMQITLKGLRGGHSGCDIHTNRANAIKVMARFLADLSEAQNFLLSDIHAGTVRNAIPREAAVTIAFAEKDRAALSDFIAQFEAEIKTELAVAEPNLQFITQTTEAPAQVFDSASNARVIHALSAMPNGVIRYSDAVADVVETSLSVGVVKTENDNVSLIILSRSLIESGKADVRSRLLSLAKLAGARVEFSGNYPGWQPDPDSAITTATQKIYDDILGYPAEIKVIHAGLECGLMKKAYPDMDIVSIGPTIKNAHSPDEKVHIPAVETYWTLLTRLLAAI